MLKPDNQNVFWNYIKSRKKDNFGVSSPKKDGLAYSADKQKAELLNKQFSSVFTKEDMAQRPILPPSSLPTLNQISWFHNSTGFAACFNVKVNNFAFDTSKVITNAWFSMKS